MLKKIIILFITLLLLSCGSEQTPTDQNKADSLKTTEPATAVGDISTEMSDEPVIEDEPAVADEPVVVDEPVVEEVATESVEENIEKTSEEPVQDERTGYQASSSVLNISPGLYVQIGAFIYKSNSDNHLNIARNAGFENVQMVETSLKRVVVGPFDNLEKAKEVKETFVNLGIADTWIFTVN